MGPAGIAVAPPLTAGPDEDLRAALRSVLHGVLRPGLLAVELTAPAHLDAPLQVVQTRPAAAEPRQLFVRAARVPGRQVPVNGLLTATAHDLDALQVLVSLPPVIEALVDSDSSVRQARAMAHAALELANRDPATGLGNRRAWSQALTAEVNRHRRTGAPLTLVVLDLDGLKAVNDAQGHAAGDALIASVASALSSLGRAHDVVCRLGGDEFGVIAPHTDAGQGQVLRTRLRRALTLSGVSVSIGSATLDASDVVDLADVHGDQVWQRADAAMYDDKQLRRGAAAR